MPFVESAESVRSKLHLSDVRTASIAGIVIAAVAIVALVAACLVTLMPNDAVEIVKAEEAAEPHTSDEAALAAEPGICVHVTGAVANPGMYELAEGARVQDAIEAAGGFSDSAADSVLNLARVVSDGEQIVVPDRTDTGDAPADAEAAAEGGAQGVASGRQGSSSGNAVIAGKVNINAAGAEELDGLPGIGEATALKIIADREANGPFASIEDLQRVSGIGAKKFAQLAELVCVG
ncbi:ComEA family DNA-binding protein [Raoultibacter phocaeensis]|uniref:ComEA family DNA-binding protein n=1 Tax=Raoultibacter phocaeensis TaxID=2479841 RepID=UPI00111BBB9F|nr:ComEA family DNA-binding protein [Raoultibacter phocaeensis]